MRLLIRQQRLYKAGKEGLIAVQKQVTKKGKTFTQTFYVKPETVPSAPTRPFSTAIDLKKRPQKITLMRGDEVYDLESNRPEGGFYVATSSEAVRVPEKCIDRVFKYEGFTFVVYQRLIDPEDSSKRRWGGEYRVAELRTGKAVGGAFESAVEAKESALSKMSGLLTGILKGTIEKTVSVASIDSVIVTTDSWPIDEPKRILTSDGRWKFAEEIWKEYLNGEEGPMQLDDVIGWLENEEKLIFTIDVQDLRDSIDDEFILETAIIEGISYEASQNRWKAINEIIALAKESDMSAVTEFDYETVSDWARDYEDNFVDGFDEADYGAYYESGDPAWTAADIVAYAIENKTSLDSAQTAAEESTVEQKKGMSEEIVEQTDFTDSHGKDWDGESLSSVGAWISGQVKATREAAKVADEARRKGEVIPSHSIVETVEEHAIRYSKDEIIYRGTGYRAWLEGAIGDVIPVGMASFSKSQHRAKTFSSVVLLVIDGKNVDDDNPVMAVDIETLIEDGRDEGFSDAISQSNVDTYEEEIEVIVRAPAFKIISREANIVHIKPVEMSLLEMMKALFENQSSAELIKEMERTFDYALHREPEDL